MKTVFISGHKDVTDEEFKTYYVPHIHKAIAEGCSFVVGDFDGVDLRAQIEISLRGDKDKITVYHMFEQPRFLVKGLKTKGGYTSDDERDAAMTSASSCDIAWVRPGKEKSGTAKNIARRIK